MIEDWEDEGERIGMTGSITTLENDDDIEVPERTFPFGFQPRTQTAIPPPAVRTSNRHHDTGRR